MEQLHPVRAEARIQVAGNLRAPGIGADHLAVVAEHARRRSNGYAGAAPPDSPELGGHERRIDGRRQQATFQLMALL